MVAKIIICQDFEKKVEKINFLLKEFELNPTHPDVLYIQKDEKLGIEAARKIKDHFTYKASNSKGKAAVIEDAQGITIEAQNALLKTLEELPEYGIFLIGASSTKGFLPTVLSRCQIISLASDVIPAQAGIQFNNEPHGSRCQQTRAIKSGMTNDIENLLKADIKTRFSYIEKAKDKDEVLTSLLHYFRNKLLEGDTSKEIQSFINELLESEKWANQNVNIRGILEYLMLVLPKLK